MVYEPREDSYLFLEVLKDLEEFPKKALEIGAGSGILSRYLESQGVDCLPTDIDPDAYGIESDLFSDISGRFDLIFWNMPYLPGKGDPDTNCGDGRILRKFFKKAKDFLEKDGYILFLISTLTPLFESEIEKIGYDLEKISEKKLAFETIKVLKARPL